MIINKKIKYRMFVKTTLCCLLVILLLLCNGCNRKENITDTDADTDTTASEESETVDTGSDTSEPKISLSLLDGVTVADAKALLDGLGIKYTISYVYSSTTKDTVICTFINGARQESKMLIPSDSAVDVQISLGRAPQTESVKALDEKTIYLTFDDGPNKYTDEILATLKKYGVKATFFTVGQFVGYYPERVRAVAEAGHLIACHTDTHDFNKIYRSPSELLADIKDWEGKIEKALGYVPEKVLFRFPGGSNTSYLPKEDFYAFYNCLIDNEYMCYDWSFANNDKYLAGKPDGMSVIEYLKESTVTTLKYREKDPTVPKIMLMHDSDKNTAEALSWIIEYLQSKGYRFATLDELDGDWLFRLNN